MATTTRDIILRTPRWSEAIQFYTSVLGLPMTHTGDTIVGFETGAFCMYVEKGEEHGAVFEILVQNVQTTKHHLVAAGCVIVEEDPSVPRCYMRDPFGLVFNIGKAPAST